MLNRLLVRHNHDIIGTRLSSRVYTHAVAVWGHGETAKVMAWCGRLDLAQKAQGKYQQYGYTAEICPVEFVQR